VPRTAQGRNKGQILSNETLDRVEKILAKKDVKLVRNADAFLNTRGAGATFEANRTGESKLYLRSDPTKYELFHELKHYGDFKLLGFDEYLKLGRLGREESVFEYMQRQTWLTKEEVAHAEAYIKKLRPTP
jgi:hypothetical protein